MFLTSLNYSPLVGTAANEIFQNITGDTYRGDVSFLSAMRMLLYDRLPEGATANLKFSSVQYSDIKSITDQNDLLQIMTGHSGDLPENQVWVVEVQCNSKDDTAKANKEFAKIKNFLGMNIDPAVDSMFSAFCSSHTYIDFEHARTLFLVFDRMNNAKWHTAASLTSRYFKKYFDLHIFDGEKPRTDWETQNIAMALTKEDKPDKFNQAMLEFSKRFDFRSPMIRATLAGFENRNLNQRIEATDREISRMNEQIENDNRTYAQHLRQLSDLQEKRIGMALNIKEEKNEVMEYFLRNKNLHLVGLDGDGITFFARTPFANFNPDLAERIINNEERADRVEMYRQGDSKVTTADRDLLFKAIMLDQKIRVWLYGKFTMYVAGSDSIHAYSDFDQPVEMMDSCPNPHLYRHRCMGNNERAAIDAVMAGDYITAIEQCIGSVASVNLAETITSGPWMNNLLSDHYGRFFETEDGTMMNFTEVMKYLKEENK